MIPEELTCPKGHKYPVKDFHSYIKDRDNLDDGIVFDCPGGKQGHTFTLRKAVASGMFSIADAKRIQEYALRCWKGEE